MLVAVARTFLPVLLLVLQLAGEPQPSSTVTPIEAVSLLSREQAATLPLIYVEGTVTYVNQVWDTMFVQDKTGGLYIYSQKLPAVKEGEIVRVAGRPMEGQRGIYLELDAWEHVGPGLWPDPISVNSPSFHPIRSDSRLVEFIGFVRGGSSADQYYSVVLANGAMRVTVHLPHCSGLDIDSADFIGRQMRVRGVWSVKRADVGHDFELFVATDGLVEISSARAVASRGLDELHWVDSRADGNDLVKVRATVSLVSGQRVFIFDDAAPATVLVSDRSNINLKPGDVVDVTGFLQWDLEPPYLEDASIRVVSRVAPPNPTEISVSEVAKRVGESIRFECIVVDTVSAKAGHSLWLGAGDIRLRTVGGESMEGFHAGDRVMVEGVAWPRPPNAHPDFDLYLSSSPTVSSSASAANSEWWLLNVLGFAVLGSLVGAIAVLLWERRRQAHSSSMQQHIAARLDELTHVARINTLGDMVAALSHELNQPLASVANYAAAAAAQLGKDSSTIDGSVVKCLSGIEDQANRAGSIIRRLKNLVNRKAPEKSWANLNEVILETVDLFKTGNICPTSLIRLNLQPELPDTHLDVIQTQQVVMNLLSNALEATKDLQEAALIEVSTRCEDGCHVQVAVEDNGCGLKDEVLEAMFEPYYTTKEQGTGLGLSISRAIVESHGGVMTAQRSAIRGCQIRFVLPLQDPSNECGT